MTIDQKGPSRPEADKDRATDWLVIQKSRINKSVEEGMLLTSPEALQTIIKDLDGVLRDIAEFQNFVGRHRKKLNMHCQTLRQASPKAGLTEGAEVMFSGKPYMFINGRLYEIVKGTDDNK